MWWWLLASVDLASGAGAPPLVSLSNSGSRSADASSVEARLAVAPLRLSVTAALYGDRASQSGNVAVQVSPLRVLRLTVAVDLPSQTTTLTAALAVDWLRARVSYSSSESGVSLGAVMGRVTFELFGWWSANPSARAALTLRV